MKNTKFDQIETQTGGPFWEKAKYFLCRALFVYAKNIRIDRLKKRTLHLSWRLIRLSAPKTTMTEVNLMDFLKFEEKYGEEHIAVKQYKHFKSISQITKR